MKQIIKRNLPLDVVYTLMDKKYISIVDGYGCTCDNCGKLIANIATISNGSKSYNIGFDCLDTIIINNTILSQVDIVDYEAYKNAIDKTMKFIKHIKEVLTSCNSVTGIKFVNESFWVGREVYHTFYWLHSGSLVSRDNSNVRIKNVPTELVYKIVKDYFKSLTILIETT